MFDDNGENLQRILDHARLMLDSTLRPLESLLLQGRIEELEAEMKAVRSGVKGAGFFNPHIDSDSGGYGLTLMEFARLGEVLGRSPLGHFAFNCQAPDAGNMEILLEFASSAQRQTFLQPMLDGDVRSCFAMTEPEHAGSNPVWMSTTAVLEDDHYIINGHKWFTTAADGAAFTIVMAMTDPQNENRYQRASQILVPMDTAGCNLVRNISIMGDTGSGYFSHGEMRFNDCRVPKTNLLGAPGMGFVMAQKRLGPGRIHHCMRWIGIAERSFEMMCARAAERELSPGKPLAAKQSIQNWIAESRAEIDAARLLVLNSAEKVQKLGTSGARMDISIIKFWVANMLQRVIDRSLQVHGALGMTDDLLLSHYYRHERAARIYDGPDEVHKSVVAREILKQYQPR